MKILVSCSKCLFFNLFTLIPIFGLHHPTRQQYACMIIRLISGRPLYTETDRGGGHVPYARALAHLPPTQEMPRPQRSLAACLPPSLHDDVSN